MPIHGLTNPPKSFLRLAKIKKGEMVTNSEGKTYPRDLDYFRVVFEKGCEDVERAFRAAYGEKPTRINFRLAFPNLDEVWDAFYVCYAKGGQLARAGSNENGPYWIWYRDHSTSEVLIRDGRPVAPGGAELLAKPLDLSKPIYTYKDKEKKDVPVFLEPEGRLTIVVPEVAYVEGKPRVGFFEFCPLSPRDIRTISSELLGIDAVARNVGKDITGIPMVLTRREEMVSKNINGKMSRDKSWVVHIELAGEWGGKALEALEFKALPDNIVEGDVIEADEGVSETIEPAPSSTPAPRTYAQSAQPKEEEYEPPFPPSAPEPAATPPPSRSASESNKRPYAPEIFRAKFQEIVAELPELYAKSNAPLTVTPQEGHILASILDTTFDGDKDKRYIVCAWLCGIGSTKEMSPAVVKAFFKVLGIKNDEAHKPQFDDVPTDVSIKELRAAYEVAVKERSNVPK